MVAARHALPLPSTPRRARRHGRRAAHLPHGVRQRDEPAPGARHQAAGGGAVRTVRRRPLAGAQGAAAAGARPHRANCGPTAAPSSRCRRPRKRARSSRRGAALEAAIVRLAAQNATAADIADLRRQLQARARGHAPLRPAGVGAAGERLPPAAGGAGAQPILERYLGRAGVALLADRGAVRAAGQRAAASTTSTRRIVDCIARGDGDGAVRLMDEHLQALERNVELRREASEPQPGRDARAGVGAHYRPRRAKRSAPSRSGARAAATAGPAGSSGRCARACATLARQSPAARCT